MHVCSYINIPKHTPAFVVYWQRVSSYWNTGTLNFQSIRQNLPYPEDVGGMFSNRVANMRNPFPFGHSFDKINRRKIQIGQCEGMDYH